MRFAVGLLALGAMAADLGTLIPRVAEYDFGKDPEAVRQLEATVLNSAGTKIAPDLEKQILAGLASAKTLAAKDAFCRNLSVIGSAASVPALAPLLLKPETVEMARFALERIPGDAASAALRKALPQVPARAQAGIVGSLGRRKDSAAVAAIVPLLASPDAALHAAATGSLADIGGSPGVTALRRAKPSPAVFDALLRVAPALPAATATEIYRQLNATGHPEAVRMASLIGMAKVDTRGAVPVLVTALSDPSRQVQGVAIRELARADAPALEGKWSTLTPLAQVQALSALSASGRAEVLPLLERNLENENPGVRVAAMTGLAKIGVATQLPKVAMKASESTGEEQAAARFALASMRGVDVDAAILGAISSASPKVKAELIRATGERGIAAAPPVLLKAATDADRAVRTESIRALRETAKPADASAILSLLAATQDENERKEYERAAASAIRRSKDSPIEPVTTAYAAWKEPEVQASLLAVMAAVGNNDALPVVRGALKSDDADLRRAAINAMSTWPTATPMNDLLTLAQTATSPGEQALAVRGYVKLVQIPSDRTPAETAKLLAAGMAAAKRPEERKLVIAAAQRVISPESLELVKASLSDPAVANEAKLAATALERSLSYRRN